MAGVCCRRRVAAAGINIITCVSCAAGARISHDIDWARLVSARSQSADSFVRRQTDHTASQQQHPCPGHSQHREPTHINLLVYWKMLG